MTRAGEDIVINVTAEEGQDAQLWCPGNGLVTAWLKKREDGYNDRIVFHDVVQDKFKDHMFFDITTGNLTIHNAKLNDSGVYWCRVGFKEFEIHLTVFSKF